MFVFAQGFAVLLPTDQTESRTALCVGLSIRYRPHYPSAPAARPLTGGNTSSPKVSFAYASISCESVSSSTYRPQMLMVHSAIAISISIERSALHAHDGVTADCSASTWQRSAAREAEHCGEYSAV